MTEKSSDKTDKTKKTKMTKSATNNNIGLMNKSIILKFINKYCGNNFIYDIFNFKIIKDIGKKKWAIIGVIGGIVVSMLSAMFMWMFELLFMYISIKVLCFASEAYEPEKPITITSHSNEYVSEKNPMNIIEYVICLSCLNIFRYISSYIPYIGTLLYGACIITTIATIADKYYRQKICMYVKKCLTNNQMEYDPENVAEVHVWMQVLCHSIEYLSVSTFNIISNPLTIYSHLKSMSDISEILDFIGEYKKHDYKEEEGKEEEYDLDEEY